MRKYEVGLVISPDLEEEALAELVDDVKQRIADGDGEVLNVDNWGKRKLAYPIRRFTDGYYVFVTAEMEPSAIRSLEQNFNISEAFLRHLTTRVEE